MAPGNGNPANPIRTVIADFDRILITQEKVLTSRAAKAVVTTTNEQEEFARVIEEVVLNGRAASA